MRGRADRWWLAGGALGAVALLAVGWFFLVSPQHGRAATLREQTQTAQLSIAGQQHKLAALRKDAEQLAGYRAELDRLRQALPAGAGLSAFLRELQNAGDHAGVAVRGLSVGSPAQLTGRNASVFTLPITLTAAGGLPGLTEFLDQLQQVQPRAVLIQSVTGSPDHGVTTLAQGTSLNITLRVFVAPDQPGQGPTGAN
jgi:Tfp pilus assembly protein PilO